MYKQKPSTQGITLGKKLTLKASPSGYYKSGYYMTGYYTMRPWYQTVDVNKLDHDVNKLSSLSDKV